MSVTKESVILRLARAWAHACTDFEIVRTAALAAGENDLKAMSALRASAGRLDRAERALRRAVAVYEEKAA